MSPGEHALALWRTFSRLPFGAALFMLVLGRMVPYSGALGARVRDARAGPRAPARCATGARVRNHLGSSPRGRAREPGRARERARHDDRRCPPACAAS